MPAYEVLAVTVGLHEAPADEGFGRIVRHRSEIRAVLAREQWSAQCGEIPAADTSLSDGKVNAITSSGEAFERDFITQCGARCRKKIGIPGGFYSRCTLELGQDRLLHLADAGAIFAP